MSSSFSAMRTSRRMSRGVSSCWSSSSGPSERATKPDSSSVPSLGPPSRAMAPSYGRLELRPSAAVLILVVANEGVVVVPVASRIVSSSAAHVAEIHVAPALVVVVVAAAAELVRHEHDVQAELETGDLLLRMTITLRPDARRRLRDLRLWRRADSFTNMSSNPNQSFDDFNKNSLVIVVGA
ncbi:hypothetical protein E2562_007391 [Oryza meyeriana var. granulata]|uniref:Uncharacterized protein n=1 Tax=Oryza meyeriana var. granulata TaxID=110450 RepID=A0A6G1D1I3_9ORYZ|nr:hypothetical protein E2562_007391 [Oryza meyeriana var. granulata]